MAVGEGYLIVTVKSEKWSQRPRVPDRYETFLSFGEFIWSQYGHLSTVLRRDRPVEKVVVKLLIIWLGKLLFALTVDRNGAKYMTFETL